MASNNFALAYPELNDKVVLSVDDNEMNQLVIAKIMQGAGIRVIAAENGEVAVQQLAKGLRPDFILMDLDMPVMNGLQASGWIRKNIKPAIPIIINSGAVSELQKWKLKCLGILDYLEKPYSMRDIFDKISKNITSVPA